MSPADGQSWGSVIPSLSMPTSMMSGPRTVFMQSKTAQAAWGSVQSPGLPTRELASVLNLNFSVIIPYKLNNSKHFKYYLL